MKGRLFGFVLLVNLLLSLCVWVPGVSAGNIWSDGSFLYMGMEDGVLPHVTSVSADTTVSVDDDSLIHGKYSLNISRSSALGATISAKLDYDNYIFTNELQYKIMLREVPSTDGYTQLSLRLFRVPSGLDGIVLQFCNQTTIKGQITITNLTSNKRFTSMEPWKTNCVYTLHIFDIIYRNHSATQSHLFSATLSNETASQTLTNLQMNTNAVIYGSPRPICGWYFTSADSTLTQASRTFLDDWTVGQQDRVMTNASSGVEESSAVLNGYVNNDGSTFQNGTQLNLTANFSYSTVSKSMLNLSANYSAATNYSIHDAQDICTDGKYLYIADSENDRIVKRWLSNWTYITKIGTSGAGDNQFDHPKGITTDGRFIWVADSGNDRIKKHLCSDLSYVSKNTSSGTGNYELALPYGITVDESFIYIADTFNHRIVKRYKSNYTYFSEVGTHGTFGVGITQFHNPTGICQQGDFIFIADTLNERVMKFWKSNLSNDGVIGGNGSGNNQFWHPWKIAVDGTDIWVSDTNNNRVVRRSSSNLSFKSMIYGGLGNFSSPMGICKNSSYLYFISYDNNRLKRHYAYYSDTGVTNITATVNFTGETASYSLSGLSRGTLYYEHFSGRTDYINASSLDYGEERYFLTKPNAPTNMTNHIINSSSFRLNWTNGLGSNRTVVVKKTTGSPTSPADGTIIYNGSLNYTLISVSAGEVFYLRAWSLAFYTAADGTNLSRWSDNGTAAPWGGLLLGCHNESYPQQNLTFNVMITNQSGSQVYTASGCTTYHTINVSLCPHGVNVQLIFNVSGYQQRTYYLNLYAGAWYVFDAYLPPIIQPGNSSGYTLQAFSDTVVITSTFYTVNKVVPLTNMMDSLIAVEVYNKSISSGYGGWVPVPTAYYVVNGNNTVTINALFLASNTTMARVTYYYREYSGKQSRLYLINVINQEQIPISDCLVDVKHYINTSGIFLTVSSLMTDGNGQADIYLVPGDLYKFSFNKTGYEDSTANWIPGTEILTHTFMLTYNAGNTTPIYFFTEEIHSSGYLSNATSSLWINFTDDLSMVINMQVFVWEYNASNATATLIYSNTSINSSSYQIIIVLGNKSNDFEIVFHLNHSYFGYDAWTIMVSGYHVRFTSQARFNALFMANFGWNPFGWSNTIVFLICLGCFFSFKKRQNSFMVMFLLGFMLLFINIYIGFNTVMSVAAGGAIPVMFIFFGILMLIRDRNRIGVEY